MSAVRTVPQTPRASSRSLRRKWVAATTVGELIGFSAPALVASMIAGAGTITTLALLCAAGLVEGLVLGLAQGSVVRDAVPGITPARWAWATGIGAVVAWAIGMLPSTFHSSWVQWPPALLAGTALVLGVVLLCSLGTAQWFVLRPYVPNAWRWIPATALAWCLGLIAFMAVAMPLWHEGQSAITLITVGIGAAVVMAAVVGLVTARALPIVADRQ